MIDVKIPIDRIELVTRIALFQVGDENLRPFVINVGLQCKLQSDDVIPAECETCLARRNQREESTTERFLAAVTGEPAKITRSVGVGECLVIENPPDPQQFREIGVCTEKWIEVIKASKQTDTEDFAFKDTESPRVADLFPQPSLSAFEPEPDRVVLERRSSLRRSMGALPASPFINRKSSGVAVGPGSPSTSRKSTLAQVWSLRH